MKAQKRAEKIKRGILLAWDSCRSHLDGCVTTDDVPKKALPVYGNKAFHRKCVKEYIEIMDIFSDLW